MKVELRRMDPALVNIVQIALVSQDATYPELEDAARDLKDLLKSVDGVRTAESWAFPSRELRVQLDLGRMDAQGLSAAAVVQALQSENANIPAGVLDLGSRSFSLPSGDGSAISSPSSFTCPISTLLTACTAS